ncbi:MAG: carboxypeptidase regulatory-like domain-containing protein [Blastocatellia bacterium]|nr:carboxypeptidase regulatory-like domain-containing protein [Blastocatellia bacterium]
MKRVLGLLGKMYFVLPILFLAAISNAQITESSLRGIVTDVNGNAVAASVVVAQNDATAQVKTTTTNENGEFVFATMPSGSYTIFVRVPGFKTYELKNLKLNVGQTSEINIKLEIGEVSVLTSAKTPSITPFSVPRARIGLVFR